MGPFGRSGARNRALGLGTAVTALLAARRGLRVAAGVAAGALAVTAVSAAVSAVREKEIGRTEGRG